MRIKIVFSLLYLGQIVDILRSYSLPSSRISNLLYKTFLWHYSTRLHLNLLLLLMDFAEPSSQIL